jgi:hypothetical protein
MADKIAENFNNALLVVVCQLTLSRWNVLHPFTD